MRTLLTTLFFVGILVILGHWIHSQVRYARGLVRADPHTYVSFAENLAGGHYTVNDPLAALAEARAKETAAANPGQTAATATGLRPGPKWNWSIREDGKTVYTTAIGYPLFQAAVLRLGGKRAALLANIGLWGVIFLFLVLTVWEGSGRGVVAACAAGAGVAMLPWIDPTIQSMVELWREPLFLACLFGAAWLLLRFWRTRGLLEACAMAVLLGYACSVKEANAVYLPAFGLMFLAALFRKPGGNTKAGSVDAPAPDKAKRPAILPRLILPVGFGLLGLTPMFLHNLNSVGHPLMSPQTLRATADVRAANAESDPAAELDVNVVAEPVEVVVVPKVKRGLNLGVQYQMAHAYWWEYSVNPHQSKFWFKWWWFGVAMVGLLWLLRGTIGWRELLGAVVLTGMYAVWGHVEFELWRYDKTTWKPAVENVFQEHKIVTWLLSGAAVLALALSCRRRIGAFLLLLVLTHFALYFSWKNIDFRHMLLAVIVYALCLGVGVFTLTQVVARWLKVAESWRPVCALPLLLLALIPVLDWRPFGGDKEAVFTVGHGVAFGEALAARLEGNPVVFGNRYLSEIADVYTDVPVMRLHELLNLQDEEHDAQTLLEELKAAGHTLYFLDSRDLDPKNREWGIDLSPVDRELLLARHDLSEQWRFPLEAFNLYFPGERPEITLHRLDPRTNDTAEVALDIPRGGAALLELSTREGREGQTFTLSGVPILTADPYQRFHVVPAGVASNASASGTLQFEAEGPGLPDLTKAARLVGWTERIGIQPVTRGTFERTGMFTTYTGFDELIDVRPETPAEVLVPVRSGRNRFSAVGVNATLMPANELVRIAVLRGQRHMSNVFFLVENEAGETWKRPADEVNFFFAVHAAEEGGKGEEEEEEEEGDGKDRDDKETTPKVMDEVKDAKAWRAKLATFTLSTDSPDFYLRLHGLSSQVAQTAFEVAPDDRSTMAIVYGKLASADPATDRSPYRMTLNGEVAKEGVCYASPLRSANRFKHLLQITEPGKPLRLAFEGAGLIDAEIVLVRDRMEIPYGPRMELFPDAFFQPNQDACWTRGDFTLPVPLIPGAKKYTLTLEARDGEPDGQARPVTVRLRSANGDREFGNPETFTLSGERMTHHVTFEDVSVEEAGVFELEFAQDTWSPKRRAEVRGIDDAQELNDDRELGFHLHHFTFEPAWR